MKSENVENKVEFSPGSILERKKEESGNGGTDVKVKDIWRRKSKDHGTAQFFDKKSNESILAATERLETQMNEVKKFKPTPENYVKKLTYKRSREQLLKGNDKCERFQTYQNDESTPHSRTIFPESLNQSSSNINIKPYQFSVEKRKKDKSGTADSKNTVIKKPDSSSSLYFKHLISPKTFITNPSTDRLKTLQRTEDEIKKMSKQNSFIEKPIKSTTSFSKRLNTEGSKLSAFVDREKGKRPSIKEGNFIKCASPCQPHQIKSLRNSTNLAKGSGQIRSTAGTQKIPNINIHLTPNDRDVEMIEIDSSVPDKCFIKFQRGTSSRQISPEHSQAHRNVKRFQLEHRDSTMSVDERSILNKLRSSKARESATSIGVGDQTSKILRPRDVNRPPGPLSMYSQRRENISSLRKVHRCGGGLIARYDSAVLCTHTEREREERDSTKEIESKQKMLADELQKLTSIYESQRNL